jgi:BirA family biotin operon repressor/biotin-[acetyl-CoA-carboxylase] ligase
MDQLDIPRIQSVLNTHTFGRHLRILPGTDSTNDVAKKAARQGAPEGTVILADEQTAGRGRLGRRWVAPPGTCLLCSIVFRIDILPTQAQWLTMLCALAASDAVAQVAGLHVSLKWPNDLIIQSSSPPSGTRTPGWRKLAGVLTETEVYGDELRFVVVGIGINVNVDHNLLPTLAPDATSILAETGRKTDRTTLLATLLERVETRHAQLQTGQSPYAEWSGRLSTLGQEIQVSTADGSLTGVAESVDKDGALLLRSPDGKLIRLVAGDVTLARS